MPVLDMPLADLEKYRGRNPKPRNFDAFWDAGLAEIDQLVEATERSIRDVIREMEKPWCGC